MKQLFFIALVAITLFMQSCCTKKSCDATSFAMSLYNFEASDLDTVIVMTYVGDDSFRKLLDSAVIETMLQSDGSSTLPTGGRLDIGKNYKIIMYGTGMVYKIKGLQTTRKGCNSCFPFRPASDYYDVLANYNLNGDVWTREDIAIWCERPQVP